MYLQKANSVDALNRTSARSAPLGVPMFGGVRSVGSPVADVESPGTAPPRAKVPSWYRNLHHSLLSMDGDSDSDDDDDDDAQNGDDDGDFELRLVKSRRTASVDVDLNVIDSSRQQHPRHPATMTDERKIPMKRAESVDVVSSIRDTRGRPSILAYVNNNNNNNNNSPVATPSVHSTTPRRHLQADIQHHNQSKFIEKPSENGTSFVTSGNNSVITTPQNSTLEQISSLGIENGVDTEHQFTKLPPALPKSAPPGIQSTSPVRRRQRDPALGQNEDNYALPSNNRAEVVLTHDNHPKTHFQNDREDITSDQFTMSTGMTTSQDIPTEVEAIVGLNGDLMTSSNSINPPNSSSVVRRQLPACPATVSVTTPPVSSSPGMQPINRMIETGSPRALSDGSSNSSPSVSSSLGLSANRPTSPDSGNDTSNSNRSHSERRAWTAELSSRTMTSELDEQSRRTRHHSQQRPTTNADAITGARNVAMVTAVVDERRSSTYVGSAVITQPKRQFKWTVAEPKSLGRPLTSGQIARPVTPKNRLPSRPAQQDIVVGVSRQGTVSSVALPLESAQLSQNENRVDSDRGSIDLVLNSQSTRTSDRHLQSMITNQRQADYAATTVTPNIRNVLAKFKSVEALANADRQPWTVTSLRSSTSRPSGRLTTSGPALKSLGDPSFSRSKSLSMDNVSTPMSLSVSHDTPSSRDLNIVDDSSDKKTSDDRVLPEQPSDNDHHRDEPIDKTSKYSTRTIIPPFVQMQLQKFQSLEDITQRPPTPTRLIPANPTPTPTRSPTVPSFSAASNSKATSNNNNGLQRNDATAMVDRRQGDQYVVCDEKKDSDAVNGSVLHSSESTTSSPSMPFQTRRSSEQVKSANRSLAARQWSPIVHLVTSQWSPYSKSDVDSTSKSGTLPPRSTRPASAMSVAGPGTNQTSGGSALNGSVDKGNAAAAKTTQRNHGHEVDGAKTRRLPCTPSTKMHNTVLKYGSVEVFSEQPSGSRSPLDGLDGPENALTTHGGLNQATAANHLSTAAKIDFRFVDQTPVDRLTTTSTSVDRDGVGSAIKSELVSDLPTSDTEFSNSDQPVMTSSPTSPVQIKVMSSLFVTLQPIKPSTMTSQCHALENSTRIRIISSRRVN